MAVVGQFDPSQRAVLNARVAQVETYSTNQEALVIYTVIDGCVGCGLCGENAHAATLCPSFYRAEVVQNPRWHERLIDNMRRRVTRAMQPA